MKNIGVGAVVVVYALLVVFTTEAQACSCMAKPSVLDEFENSQDVFVAKVTAFEAIPSDRPQRYDVTGRAKMVVSKVYKGDLKPGDEVEFIQGSGADCILTYTDKSIGWELLIYNTPYNGKRGISICGRTTDVDSADDDLRYLDNLAWAKGKTRISGSVSFGFYGEVPEGQTVAGKKIKIVGSRRTFVATTDVNGIYEIYDVPPGRYYLEPELPPGWRLNDYTTDRTMMGSSNVLSLEYGEYLEKKDVLPNRFPIRVSSGRHVSFDFMYEVDNAIRGRLLGPNGKPMKDICVHAVPAHREESLFGSTDCTNSAGRFEITRLNHDRYILVINGDEEVSGKTPIPKTFFPGVLDRKKAAIIKIGPGLKPHVRDFRLPKVLETVTLKGVLLYANGKPVATRKVQFALDNPTAGYKPKDHHLYDYTERNGSFEIKLLKGQSGRIRGEFYTGKKQIERCPEWRKAILEESSMADWMLTAVTEWVEIKGDRDVKDIKFIFPFNECEDE